MLNTTKVTFIIFIHILPTVKKITSNYFQLYILPSATIVTVKLRNKKYDILINFLVTKLLNIRPKITTLIANSIYHLKTVKTLKNLNETL